MLFLGTLLKHSSQKLGYACIIRDHTASRYTDCRLYPEPLWFPSLYFVSCSPQSSWPHFAMSFSSEMAILIYSLCFPRLWDMVFSLGRMCFECTLLFKIIFLLDLFILLSVWVFWLHACLCAMWVLGATEDQKRVLRALALWLWMVVNQHSREGWNHSTGVESTSVCISWKLFFTFH